ncbi:hypothetical protein Lser_V15G21046 [Lactuca serriola]
MGSGFLLPNLTPRKTRSRLVFSIIDIGQEALIRIRNNGVPSPVKNTRKNCH